MKYHALADAYARIEATTSRLEMTALLADLFRQTPPEVIGRVVYLTQGKLYPDYEGIEIGVAEKLAVRAVAAAAGADAEEVERRLARAGDLGLVAEELLAASGSRRATLTVDEVYGELDRSARASGKGAQAAKLDILAGLLRRATPAEAKYIVRTVTGRLRLGVGDMTVLDALATVFAGGREARRDLERAYNLTSDLGYVAETVARGGVEAIRRVHVVVGKPIRPMLAERLGDPAELLEKMGGRCIAEYKYDGERLQIHKQGERVELFSRRLEKITSQYPDVAELVGRHVRATEAILEGEVVAVDPDTGDLRPFQDLMPRRRKYGIEEAMREIPVAVYLFDALFADGEDLTERPYAERHARLETLVTPGERMGVATYREVATVRELEEIFEQAVQDGCEGLVCKAPGGVYQAGARGWLWIKFKREYRSEMTDAVDLVVVGAFHGRGRRGGTYGALLMAAYDPQAEMFRTVCKLGSGFTDEFLAELPGRLRPYQVPDRPRSVDSRLEPDVWIEPALVFEVIGAEITLSPVHTAGWGAVREGSGLAIRFPRFTRERRDKGPTEATTVDELVEMYRRQLKKAG
ncbi:MAG: ATP-dependent DNA ligase [Armatimonadota bacterium]|nr:ATP-dependent DNA ligase [Armatimonadota bacterium]MDR7436710.1 ATP-dependent DNA ligase [Armatimonadota bacterium]MDR7507354.1 ATP-dependent DNA ligase [Armatimonadota bacterium]MDR7515955.1 ATP-dependent DNA ligase [Armatimonadota bacterium]MDR7561835.1 ATP-dependent DNA ligase [Armatimonadota bacterium]